MNLKLISIFDKLKETHPQLVNEIPKQTQKKALLLLLPELPMLPQNCNTPRSDDDESLKNITNQICYHQKKLSGRSLVLTESEFQEDNQKS